MPGKTGCRESCTELLESGGRLHGIDSLQSTTHMAGESSGMLGLVFIAIGERVLSARAA